MEKHGEIYTYKGWAIWPNRMTCHYGENEWDVSGVSLARIGDGDFDELFSWPREETLEEVLEFVKARIDDGYVDCWFKYEQEDLEEDLE